MVKKPKMPKFSLFHGPGLKLHMKWRCPKCSAHSTELAIGEGSRGIDEWNKAPHCKRCLEKGEHDA